MRENKNLQEVCPWCGFYLPDYTPKKHHLDMMQTILKGRYLVGAVLGEGGFGITYGAYDLAENQRVAIKEMFLKEIVTRKNGRTILVDSTQRTAKYYSECQKQFLREAKVLNELKDKEGVVSILDYFSENNTVYIVMEYLDGVDLKKFLADHGGKIPYMEAWNFLRPVMKSMFKVHQEGIIHRDISPDNIRYLDNNRMKLMDFGSALSVAGEASDALVLYKRGYAPPEQYENGYKVGPWMDVYAMAATIYRCITGKTPKESKKRTSDNDIVLPSSIGADIPPGAEQVLLRAMSLDADSRYIDMREFYKYLKRATVPEEEEIGDESTDGNEVSTKDRNSGNDDSSTSGGSSGSENASPQKTVRERYLQLTEELSKEPKDFTWLGVVVVLMILALIITVLVLL